MQKEQENQKIKLSRIFDPDKYINQYYAKPQGHSQENLSDPFYRFMNKAFNLLPQCQVGIQIGCGPVLTLAAFSSRKIKNNYLTDFNTSCFVHIEKFMLTESQKSSWKNHLQIISKMQNTNEDVNKRTKNSIVGCLKIDLTTNKIFYYPFFKKVDIITSSLCIQAVATDKQSYIQIIKNLSYYLKPKGYIYLIGVLQESFYMVENQKLPCFKVTQQILVQSMNLNGLKIICFQKQIYNNPPTQTSDFQGLFSILAQLQ